jgi:hypothetical protein
VYCGALVEWSRTQSVRNTTLYSAMTTTTNGVVTAFDVTELLPLMEQGAMPRSYFRNRMHALRAMRHTFCFRPARFHDRIPVGIKLWLSIMKALGAAANTVRNFMRHVVHLYLRLTSVMEDLLALEVQANPDSVDSKANWTTLFWGY